MWSLLDRGSSPRPWGTPAAFQIAKAIDRFIPTPVGNTHSQASTTRKLAVHPHARGEHRSWTLMPNSLVGSSPRPWGTPRFTRRSCGLPRFIPTPVGNTPGHPASTATVSVHPHARGEHSSQSDAGTFIRGSSPRPWGTPAEKQRLYRQRRFIPTPVGNTPAPLVPQVGGCGSSPRPWGTLLFLLLARRLGRFIPTHVGNTLSWSC